MYRYFFKRFLDFWIALVALVCLSPLLLIVIVWLYFCNKGAGVFFVQDRPGKNEKIFKILKFKTMTDERDASGKLLPDVQRLTKVGRFLRSTSIDELPQLINILKGDMALIGPRPLSVKYIPYYTEEEHHRHDVRPGITGLAQVNGRKSLTWEQKFAYDLEYVNKLSFCLDVKIFFKTIVKIIKRSDVKADSVGVVSFHILRQQEQNSVNEQGK